MRHLTIIMVLFFLSCGGIEIKGLDEAIEKVSDKVEEEIEGSDIQLEPLPEEFKDSDFNPDDYVLVTEQYAGEERLFIGTFEAYNGCYYFPVVARLYSLDDTVYFEDNAQNLFSESHIYDDDTFDVSIVVLGFGETYEDPCTCAYNQSEWYADQVSCVCNSGCSSIYTKM